MTIVALQRYICFCCITKWNGYMYTYIPSLSNLPPTPHPTPLGHHRAVLLIVQPYFERNCFQTPQANKSSTFWWWICVQADEPIQTSHTTIFYFPSFSLASPRAREVWVAWVYSSLWCPCAEAPFNLGHAGSSSSPLQLSHLLELLFNPMLIHWLIHWLIQIQLQVNRTTAPPTHAHTCFACHQYYHFNGQCSKSGESAPAAAVGLWIDHPPAEPRTSISETPSVLTQSSVLSLMNPYFHHPFSLLWACGEFL